MANKTNNTPPDPTVPVAPTGGGEEFKDQNLRYNLSKFEYDLYHEEDDKTEKIIRVKRVSLPNKGERWKIFEDNKVVFTIEGAKISKKEREFLTTVDGFNFILSKAKIGIKSFNGLRRELKELMDSKTVVEVKKKRGRPKKK